MGFPILVRWHLYIESGPSNVDFDASLMWVYASCWTNSHMTNDNFSVMPLYCCVLLWFVACQFCPHHLISYPLYPWIAPILLIQILLQLTASHNSCGIYLSWNVRKIFLKSHVISWLSKQLMATICAIQPLCSKQNRSWWRHQMETFSALLALFAENSLVTGEFPAQRPVTQSFDVFFDLSEQMLG